MRIKKFIAYIPLVLVMLAIVVQAVIAAPRYASSLIEGRTYDQAHNFGYIDWSGSVWYTNIYHRSLTVKSPDEGGQFCGSGCTEPVSHISSGSSISGSFQREVSYFEAMGAYEWVGGGVGTITVSACGSSGSWNLQKPNNNTPGFNSFPISVPAGCRTWSVRASGGHVHVRSVDAIYVAAPPTATPTATFTATATFTPTNTPTNTPTFTPTFTPTVTFTPTSTFTPTPTFTPTNTPVPPSISGSMQCGATGNDNWCLDTADLNLSASDPQGFSLSINGELNSVPFSCPAGNANCTRNLAEGTGTASFWAISAAGMSNVGTASWKLDSVPPAIAPTLPAINGANGWYLNDILADLGASDITSGLASTGISVSGNPTQPAPITLSDGVHILDFLADDLAGHRTSTQRTVSVDSVPPILSVQKTGTEGDNGWYLSDVDVQVIASDVTSGVDTISNRVNGGVWTSGDTILVGEGIPTVEFLVHDRAGNQRIISEFLSIDQTPPDSHFLSPVDGEVVSGIVELHGTTNDALSGPARAEYSVDDGAWEPVPGFTAGWIFTWDTRAIRNGEHLIRLRADDIAGNRETVYTAEITLIVDNHAPPTKTPIYIWSSPTPSPSASPTASPTASATMAPTVEATQTATPIVRIVSTPTPKLVLPLERKPLPSIPWKNYLVPTLVFGLLLALLSTIDPRPAALHELEKLGDQWMEITKEEK
jgi:hypothetical protein